MKRYSVISRILCVSLLLTLFFCCPQPVSAADQGARAGLVATQSTALNVRSKASSSSAVVSSLAKGSYVTLVRESGSWWYVEYDHGKYGYCHGDYIQVVSNSYAAFVNTASSSLNVRAGAGTSYEIQERLPKGTGVVVMSQAGDWFYILYHGTELGYVSASYLKGYSGSQTYAPISLSTQDYKQYDARWASVQLGNSGKNIAAAGCLTSALAIVESYRTGSAVTPAAMAGSLSYTSDGSLYWPSRYAFTTVSPLPELYRLLQQGKPVIFGSRNSKGGQHWVVVTGYTGGNQLTAASFVVRDPGSSARTTLQQVLDVYPIYYKSAYFSRW